jgi:predicted ABC-type exoprotein transport system permease subunit
MANVTTPAGLFRHRMAENARFQTRLVRMAVDWTVALYIVLPALGFAAATYISWWREPPAAFSLVPASALSGLFFALSLVSGGYRFFVLEADQLFVRGWTEQLLRCGLLYSAALQTLGAAALAGLLLPLLRAMPVPAPEQLRLIAAGWALWLTACAASRCFVTTRCLLLPRPPPSVSFRMRPPARPSGSPARSCSRSG